MFRVLRLDIEYTNLVAPVAMVLFDLSLSRSSSDSEIQRKKWVPNQDQNVSCTRDEMSRTPPNKLMGRVDMCFSDFNCNDTW